MAIAINTTTKHDNCSVEGLSWTSTQGIGLACQLDTEIKEGQYVEMAFNGDSTLFISLQSSTKGATALTSGTRNYWGDGTIYPGGNSYGATFTTSDVMGISVLGGNIRFWKNGVAQPELAIPPEGMRYPSFVSGNSSTYSYSGVFRIESNAMQYLPSGYVGMGDSDSSSKIVFPTPVILSTMPTALTRGFR